MLATLDPSAAFRNSQQAARGNGRTEGLVIQAPDRSQIRFQAACSCCWMEPARRWPTHAASIAPVGARPPYLTLAGSENPVTELGIKSMRDGIAMAGLQKRFAALPAFARSREPPAPVGRSQATARAQRDATAPPTPR